MKRKVVIGFYGTVLDQAFKKVRRWARWRPTLATCRFPEMPVGRLEILHATPFDRSLQILIDDVAEVSPTTKVQTHELVLNNPWDFEEVFAALHAFAVGYRFKPDEEEYLIHITTGTHVAQICLFLLTEAHYFPGKLLQTSPPKKDKELEKTNDYVAPPGFQTIIDLDLSRYDQIASRFQLEQQEGRTYLKSGIETRNPAFNRLIDQIEQVAIGSSFPILLMGPTGAGKTQLARKIFELKRLRRQIEGTFVEVNCATLRGEGAMSTLFGHVRGAFTGALADRPGLLRTANRGLLFLDEIGELGSDEQAMLLRALEQGTFMPVGSDREVHSNFQLIAGTNRDLWENVRKGDFREDLLARINLWTFDLPSLRERPEDIEPNVYYELDHFARKMGRKITFNKEAFHRFLRFATSAEASWRANFRDLNAAMSRMGTLAPGGRINEEVVNDEIERLKRQWNTPNQEDSVLRTYFSDAEIEAFDLFDRAQLAQVIRTCKESRNMAAAGRRLFQASRAQKKSTNDSDRLRKYLARFGLNAQTFFG